MNQSLHLQNNIQLQFAFRIEIRIMRSNKTIKLADIKMRCKSKREYSYKLMIHLT